MPYSGLHGSRAPNVTGFPRRQPLHSVSFLRKQFALGGNCLWLALLNRRPATVAWPKLEQFGGDYFSSF
jgi:hypothetical protein